MTAKLYPLYRQSLLSGTSIDLTSVAVKVVLVDEGLYTYSDTHQFLSDIAAGARIATTAALAGKTVTNGTFNATSPAGLVIASGQPSIEAYAVYVDTGVAGTSALLCYSNVAGGTPGLPLTPNGGTVTLTFDSGADKVFSL